MSKCNSEDHIVWVNNELLNVESAKNFIKVACVCVCGGGGKEGFKLCRFFHLIWEQFCTVCNGFECEDTREQ